MLMVGIAVIVGFAVGVGVAVEAGASLVIAHTMMPTSASTPMMTTASAHIGNLSLIVFFSYCMLSAISS
jgi:putative effector of murein hydrolase